MKIGILTFHCAHNFGAILQAYAIQEQIRLLGHEVSIINYRPKYLDKGSPKLHYWMFTRGRAFDTIKRYFKITRKLKKSYKLYKQFENKYLSLTQKCEEAKELAQLVLNFDCLILGSDQIWNQQFNGGENIWFGAFEHYKGKILTYAASAGRNKLSIEQEKELKKNISKFVGLGIREPELAESLKSTINKNVPTSVVLDPTLMVNPLIWEKMFTYKPNGKYILVYQARECTEVYNIAQRAAKYYQAEIISVDFWDNSFRIGVKQIAISPNKFVSYVKHAQCVITTSFHGTAFSLLCNTPFYSICLNAPSDDRIKSLLISVGLIERFIDKYTIPTFDKIDFCNANQIIEKRREQSQLFLIKLIKNAIIIY